MKDLTAFLEWFNRYRFGDAIEIWTDRERRTVAFGGYEQYPSAYPVKPDPEGFDEPLDDPEIFARELAAHLEPGEVVNIVAGGNEKLRYVSFTQLIVAADHPERFVCRGVSSDWSKAECLDLIADAAADQME
ncbi:MAG: hypothetical protein AB7I30_05620 [Isosphaeraceae bacterium]